MNIAILIYVALLSFFGGAFFVIGYMVWRMMRGDGWDDSNITNALRLISHTVLHPQDFLKMYYLDPDQRQFLMDSGYFPVCPFWYLSKDELSEVVDTRPDEEA